MAGGKETTRQKLINIMYLVLIAMLALNVSDSVLNAFRNLRTSMTTAKDNSQASIDQLFTTFEATKLKESPVRAKPLLDTAKMAKGYADDLNKYVEDLKQEMIKEGEGMDTITHDVTKRSDLDITPRMMIKEGKAKSLKGKILETRQKLIGLLNPKDQGSVTFTLNAEDFKNGSSWEEGNFGDGTPLTAALTVLTKIQADTKNAETEIVKRIFGKMDQALVTLDKFNAVAVAPSSYVIAGQPYTAEVFLTASDSKSNPVITVGGSVLPTTEGKGRYSVVTSKEGVYTWTGTIMVKQTDGTSKPYSTGPQTYQVAKPSAVVSADKMNVLYIGVPNPVSVSAPGIAKEKLKVTMEGGEISGSGGNYTATVTNVGKATFTVSGDIGGGKMQVLGSTEFRTKHIPPPIPQFAGKTTGSTSAANIRAQDRLFADLKGFDFDAKFNITGYKLYIIKPRQEAIQKSGTSGVLSPDVKAALSTVTPGTLVLFTGIIAVGPDGLQQDIGAVTLTAAN